VNVRLGTEQMAQEENKSQTWLLNTVSKLIIGDGFLTVP
jgi:hypothetical protein